MNRKADAFDQAARRERLASPAIIQLGHSVRHPDPGGLSRAVTQEEAQTDGLISVKILNSSGEVTGEAFDVYVFLNQQETSIVAGTGYILAHTGLPLAEDDYIEIFKDVDDNWYMSSTLIKATKVKAIAGFSSSGDALEMVGEPDTTECHAYEADIYVLGVDTETDGLADQDVTTVCGADE